MDRKGFIHTLITGSTAILGGFFLWILKNFFFFHTDFLMPQLGTVSQLKKNSIVHFKKHKLFIIQDSKGLYALSDICTHRGCRLLYTENSLICPCHNASFNLVGDPITGPTTKPLPRFFIFKNKQNILTVNVSQNVDVTFRFTE